MNRTRIKKERKSFIVRNRHLFTNDISENKGDTMHKIKNSQISLVAMNYKMNALALLLALVMTLVTSLNGSAAPTLPPGNTAEQWNTIAENTVVGSGAFQAEGLIYMGYVSSAVYNAVVAIEGGYEPFGSGVTAAPGASTDAAVIEAAYRTLVN